MEVIETLVLVAQMLAMTVIVMIIEIILIMSIETVMMMILVVGIRVLGSWRC